MTTIQSKLNLLDEGPAKVPSEKFHSKKSPSEKEGVKGHIIDPSFFSQPATIPTANDLRIFSGSLFGDVVQLYKHPLVYMDGFKTAHIIRRLDFGEYLQKVSIFWPAHT
jgi:hypothetical protein